MQNERKSSGINIGSASIIMVFSVLCLTVFAVLTFITANSENKLAVKSADAIRNYYTADTLATEKMADLQTTVLQDTASTTSVMDKATELGMTTENTSAGMEFCFSEKIDDEQDLSVRLLYVGTTLKVTEWKMINNSQWNPSNDIKLWGVE